MKFAFFTLGCKVNLFETQALSQLAAERGHEIVDSGADAVIINTCTVTSVSDHKKYPRVPQAPPGQPPRGHRGVRLLCADRPGARTGDRRGRYRLRHAGPRTDHRAL